MAEKRIRYGRREPYTSAGIARLPCVRCGKRAMFQWNACADGNLWRPLCGRCDVAVNRMVLRWMRDPLADKKADAYAKSRGIA
jgi:hypothetical protein